MAPALADNNAFKIPTAGHVIARNRIFGCMGSGLSIGSGPHGASAPAAGMMIAGNQLWDNNGTGLRTNGPYETTFFFANADADGMVARLAGSGSASKNASFADPADRAKIGRGN